MDVEPKLPIAISFVGSKYLLFDIEAVTWLRKNHHVCGVMTGTLPQAPSQNIFLGLPVQIMPEEVQLLVEKRVAYVVNDAEAHDRALQDRDASKQAAYMSQVRKKGEQVYIARTEGKEEAKRQSLKKSKGKSKVKDESSSTSKQSRNGNEDTLKSPSTTQSKDENETLLFDSTPTTQPDLSISTLSSLQINGIVPTSSNLWLTPPSEPPPISESLDLLPNVPSSYPLYKHLNSKAYFVTPGLRFGCQYCVYPGDPLRFHSHFLAVGKDWDEEIDLMDIVGGGRLGTGVKKGYLIGGREPGRLGRAGSGDGAVSEGPVRTFSIEWAAM